MKAEGLLSDVAASAREAVAGLVSDGVEAPGEAARLAQDLAAALPTGNGVRAFADILVLLVAAGGLEWLYWTYALPVWRDAEASEPRSRREAWRVALRRTLGGGLAILVSLVALLGASTAFDWPPGVHDLVVTLGIGVAIIRMVALAVVALLSPRAARLRVVAVRTAQARSLARWIIAGTAVLVAGLLLPDLVGRLGGAGHLAGAIRALTVAVFAGMLLAGSAAVESSRRRHETATSPRRRLPTLPLPFLTLLAIVAVLVLQAGGLHQLALTLVILLVTLLAEMACRRVVRALWEIRAEDQPRADDDATAAAPPSVLQDLSLRFARFLVGLLGVLALAIAWEIPLLQVSSMETPAGHLVQRALGAIAVLLVADMGWAALKGVIDNRLERIAMTSDPEAGSNARLLTLLPLGRKAAGVVILCLAVLSVLSVFGVEITPLLAGAGVVGIAVGFGAQTLVRDILSGVFYLIEDVFRIGDYIEGGSSAKGTVERITLRTVALRHQNGPLHFVPYGVLGAVRNNSRDWVVDKFEIPLPVDVDSEFVRKTVKRIGQQMLEDPVMAAIIVEPLKAKLYRIVPGAKIFRCKVQTPPGKQFEVRNEAYRRIEGALRDAGIRFADNNAQVIVQGSTAPPAAASAASAPA